jgi:hypothetical protein
MGAGLTQSSAAALALRPHAGFAKQPSVVLARRQRSSRMIF